MLKHKINLECTNGHRWFARDPSVFVGRPCGAGVSGGGTRPKSCEQVLSRVEAIPPRATD